MGVACTMTELGTQPPSTKVDLLNRYTPILAGFNISRLHGQEVWPLFLPAFGIMNLSGVRKFVNSTKPALFANNPNHTLAKAQTVVASAKVQIDSSDYSYS